jgi:hypothetical protein
MTYEPGILYVGSNYVTLFELPYASTLQQCYLDLSATVVSKSFRAVVVVVEGMANVIYNSFALSSVACGRCFVLLFYF